MKLSDLLKRQNICIQCHDNPDADAIASGFGLYKYFLSMGKDVKLIYSGRNIIQKSNLTLMVSKLNIPIRYISLNEAEYMHFDGLLITVDCQYGAGNVTRIEADDVAIIDHHRVEIDNVEKTIIQSALGSCATLVWTLLREEGYDVNADENLSTALFYGLYTDTNQFAELSNPVDRDAMDMIQRDNSLINLFKNSNISLNELEIAGVALLRYSFNEDHGFAVIKSQACDPNVLGIISDFLLQVEGVNACLVYNEVDGGFKLSVRSCVREVNASELAAFLTEDIGSGGGHYTKAGGFVNKKLFIEKYPALHSEAYFNNRMAEYFDMYELIFAETFEADLSSMKQYFKNKLPIGFVRAKDALPVGTPVTVRTLEGDIDMTIGDDTIILIGIKGEVYPNKLEKFERSYQVLEGKYIYDECVIDNDYIPVLKNRLTGENLILTDYAGVCVPTGRTCIYAKQIDKHVKVFTSWDKEKYMRGKPGDFLAVRSDDLNDVYIVEEKIFGKTYTEI